MTTWREFNLNEYVRVKITDEGWRVLIAQDDELNERLKAGNANWRFTQAQRKREEQERDGDTKWQLWDLMQTFGAMVQMGRNPPFETTIKIGLADE